MRAKSKIYHIDCFRCCTCLRQLVPGDEFALRDGGALYCKEDHDVMEKGTAATGPPHSTIPAGNAAAAAESNNNTSLSNNNHSNASTELGCMSGMYLFSHQIFYHFLFLFILNILNKSNTKINIQNT